MSAQELRPKVQALIERLNEGMLEREEVIAIALLGTLAGENIFLYGPPGTAKSLISRRLGEVFEDNSYFEYLMQRFSTPEEVFGPVSLKDLKEDKYQRKVEGYLPDADFAFLDEIWKASTPILNTLLTIINEKLFRNGTKVDAVPLKALISASNETPVPDQGLEALYDRFLLRVSVNPLKENENFELMLQSQSTDSSVQMPAELHISHEDWVSWQGAIDAVTLSDETLQVINDIRAALRAYNDREEIQGQQAIYISDRRWQKAARLIKAAAFFSDRDETSTLDATVLSYCLWSEADQEPIIMSMVEDAINTRGISSTIGLQPLEQAKKDLQEKIIAALYYVEDSLETTTLSTSPEPHLKGDVRVQSFEMRGVFRRSKKIIYYLPASFLKTRGVTNPVDEQGNSILELECTSQGNGGYNLKYHEGTIVDSDTRTDGNSQVLEKWPKIISKSGSRRASVAQSIKDDLVQQVEVLEQAIEQVMTIISDSNSAADIAAGLFTPASSKRLTAARSDDKQQAQLQNLLKETNLLRDVIKS